MKSTKNAPVQHSLHSDVTQAHELWNNRTSMAKFYLHMDAYGCSRHVLVSTGRLARTENPKRTLRHVPPLSRMNASTLAESYAQVRMCDLAWFLHGNTLIGDLVRDLLNVANEPFSCGSKQKIRKLLKIKQFIISTGRFSITFLYYIILNNSFHGEYLLQYVCI